MHSAIRANRRIDDVGGTREATVSTKLQGRQKLDGRQIVELAKMCDRIEKHYKFPCDIEWALECGQFYIVQSRPIMPHYNGCGWMPVDSLNVGCILIS